jgi:hypothetical protein
MIRLNICQDFVDRFGEIKVERIEIPKLISADLLLLEDQVLLEGPRVAVISTDHAFLRSSGVASLDEIKVQHLRCQLLIFHLKLN